jgi:hypothetical protein
MANVPVETPAPTGNALSDASSAPALTPAQLNAIGVGLSGTLTSQGSDCLWPPPGMFGIGTGIISLSLGVPCLFTKSEARAVMGAALMLLGGFILFSGVGLMAAVAGAPAAMTLIFPEGKAAGAARSAAPVTASTQALAA